MNSKFFALPIKYTTIFCVSFRGKYDTVSRKDGSRIPSIPVSSFISLKAVSISVSSPSTCPLRERPMPAVDMFYEQDFGVPMGFTIDNCPTGFSKTCLKYPFSLKKIVHKYIVIIIPQYAQFVFNFVKK